MAKRKKTKPKRSLVQSIDSMCTALSGLECKLLEQAKKARAIRRKLIEYRKRLAALKKKTARRVKTRSHTGCQEEQNNRDAAQSLVDDLEILVSEISGDLVAAQSLLDDAQLLLAEAQQQLDDCLVHS